MPFTTEYLTWPQDHHDAYAVFLACVECVRVCVFIRSSYPVIGSNYISILLCFHTFGVLPFRTKMTHLVEPLAPCGLKAFNRCQS